MVVVVVVVDDVVDVVDGDNIDFSFKFDDNVSSFLSIVLFLSSSFLLSSFLFISFVSIFVLIIFDSSLFFSFSSN